MAEQDIGDTVIDLRIDYGGDTEFGQLLESVLHESVTTGGPHLEIYQDGKVVTVPKDEHGGVYLPAKCLRELVEGINNLKHTRVP